MRDAGELARLSSCTALAGDLVVRGGALEAAPPLTGLRSIAGSVHIGPTLALASVDLLSGLVAVEGSLIIDSNLTADGVYLPALRRVGGDFIVTNNVAASGVNAPALAEVGGDLRVGGNPSLARVDISQLRRVAGRFEVSRNAALDDLAASRLTFVGHRLVVEDNPALPPTTTSELRQRADRAGSVPLPPPGGPLAP